ncbi:MAG: Holliday junction branch migration protein RuvA [Magnetococcales bacterium]|nr:Holliday junction branch migration protein RuvA [Magnetococcales bacterium]
MIAQLRGKVALKEPGEMVLDVGGVGYRLFIPLSTYERLPAVDEPFQLLTITQVREDAFHLYGFSTAAERNLFTLLNNVNGIGAKLALSALSTLPPETLTAAIARQDVALLSSIPGVGKKTAQRIIMELREKLPILDPSDNRAPSQNGAKTAPPPPASLREEVLSALVNLGYRRVEAEQAVRATLSDEVEEVGQGIRLALKALAR